MIPRRPAVFFDRDNTLIANDGYLGDPAGVVLVEGAPELVARVRALGFATVIFSNQSGVARGLFDEDDVRAVNARLDQLLAASDPNALIDRLMEVEDMSGDEFRALVSAHTAKPVTV